MKLSDNKCDVHARRGAGLRRRRQERLRQRPLPLLRAHGSQKQVRLGRRPESSQACIPLTHRRVGAQQAESDSARSSPNEELELTLGTCGGTLTPIQQGRTVALLTPSHTWPLRSAHARHFAVPPVGDKAHLRSSVVATASPVREARAPLRRRWARSTRAGPNRTAQLHRRTRQPVSRHSRGRARRKELQLGGLKHPLPLYLSGTYAHSTI
eukprot:3046601-Pleurochrysis_carterae.AAC.2